jgi:hypothetical protein
MMGSYIMISDEELKQFYNWLAAKGDHPSVMQSLRWVAEFEAYAEDDEAAFIKFKAMVKLKAPVDAEAASALRVLTSFEETEEPDPMLERFNDWLQAKGPDPTAVLARWWITEFKEAQEDNPPQEGPMPGH